MFSKEDSIKMAVSTKNIVAYPKLCAEINCDSCDSEECKLCKPCINKDVIMKVQLINAYREYINRHDCKRVFPPKFVRTSLKCIEQKLLKPKMTIFK